MVDFPRQQPEPKTLTIVVSVAATDENGNAVPGFAGAWPQTVTRERAWVVRQAVTNALGVATQPERVDDPRRA